ncbi:hypothetical protein GCM10009827_022970 [Dactylosporangium maewongense]|uniref:Nudix hydrolase domain-containing protein n=1 Tax=Dactylosporangium maewongense TaxID=634393 RepID=A0ABN1ZZJ6_9ACTN
MCAARVITVYGRRPGGTDDVGGPVRHGESPATAMVRHFVEQADLSVVVLSVLDVHAVITPDLHEDRVVFEVAPAPGAAVGDFTERPDPNGLPTGQRFAAYGFVTDPAGRVLLTQIAPGYPGAGKWHLPGGGTDPGEQPGEALLRELVEETAQHGEITELLGVTHRRNPGAIGPEGYPINWHAVRALYRVLVPSPTAPRVTEAAGGSTAAAAWFDRAELPGLQLTEVVQWAASLPRRDSDRGR